VQDDFRNACPHEKNMCGIVMTPTQSSSPRKRRRENNQSSESNAKRQLVPRRPDSHPANLEETYETILKKTNTLARVFLKELGK
jgi:hypothetical protein